MVAISSHLRHRPYQVAVATDRSLPLRKWNHLGTKHAVSHREAAFAMASELGLAGNPIEHAAPTGVVYEFAGHFIHVGLGG